MKPTAAFLADSETVGRVFGDAAVAEVAARCDLLAPHIDPDDSEAVRSVLSEAEIALGSWGMPRLSADLLTSAPRLRIVIYGAGSVKSFVTDEVFRRCITVTSAAAVNGRVVAEFVVALMTLCLKGAWRFVLNPHTSAPYFSREEQFAGLTGFSGATVGIISASEVGRAVMELLGSYPCRILLYDPYADPERVRSMGATSAALDDIMRQSDVVSLHSPSIPELHRFIDRRRLSLLKDGAWFINTARGVLVDEVALVDELATGRINACLDVTDPEPPGTDSALYTLPNVILTPHMAGAIGTDCRRLGAACMAELDRYLRGERPLHPVHADDLAIRA